MKKLYHTLAYNFENIVFLFIGIGFFGFELAYKCAFLKYFVNFINILKGYGGNVVHLLVFGY